MINVPLRCRQIRRALSRVMVLLGAVTWVAACGDSAPTAPPPNQAPLATGSIPAQTVPVGQTATVDVSANFSDPDGGVLTFTAGSSNAGVASVAVSGGVVTVTAVAQGTATVTVTARDPGGLSAQQSFQVTVPNRAPEAVGTMSPQTVFVGGNAEVELAGYFSDPDGDVLTYTTESSDAGVASVSVAGGVLAIQGVGSGEATVTVNATDPGGLSAEQSFEVTVPNRAPEAVGEVPTQTVFVAESAEVELAGYFSDPDGDTLAFTAASSNAGVARVSVEGGVVTIEAVAAGEATVTVTATDPGGLAAQQGFPVTVPNRAPGPVGSLPDQTLAAGQEVAIDVSPYFEDADGDDLRYAVASANVRVASVAVADRVVTVTGEGRGTTTVTVTANDPGGLSAEQSFEVTVPNRAPEVADTIRALTLAAGASANWRGLDHFSDPDGDSLTFAATSSNTAVALTAVVENEVLGVVGVSPGAATVTFTATDADGLSARIVFAVTVTRGSQGGVTITGTDPAVLLEGAPATVFGSGFSTTASQNQVTVGGRGARVVSASATSLSIIVPLADCLPPRREELRVSVGASAEARTVGVTPGTREDLELDPGWYRSTSKGNGCLHLPASASGGEFMIGVVSVSENAASLTGVTLAGTPGDATVVGAERGRVVVADGAGDVGSGMASSQGGEAMAAFADGPFRPMAPFAGGGMRTAVPSGAGAQEWPLVDDTLRQARARAHNEMMARNQALLRTLGRSARVAAAFARRELQVGDTLTLYADFEATCTSARQVRAVVRHVGGPSIWLDDLDNPSETFSDAELAGLDAFYSTNGKEVHDDYFGGLSDVDGNGRFLVLMTKEVNRANNVGGWVWPADLYPSARCATSNQAEIFYGQVPDPQGVVGDPVGKQTLLEYYPSLVAHEVTHLIQADAHIYGSAGGGGGKATWEWEGGATLAEQLVAYRLFGHGSGGEMGWAEFKQSAESQAWYQDWIVDLAEFFGWDWRGDGAGRITGAPEECSWIGQPDDGNSGPCLLGDRAIYGVPSMVYRYALDRWGGDYPGGERAMMRRLTQSSATGFASLVDVSPGKAWNAEQILADFYLSLWLDLRGGQAYGMSTWDLADIFGNLPENARLRPYTSSATVPRLTGRRVRAGSSLYFHWTPAGALSPTSIKVTTPGGSSMPGHIAVWAMRVR